MSIGSIGVICFFIGLSLYAYSIYAVVCHKKTKLQLLNSRSFAILAVFYLAAAVLLISI